MIPSLDEINDIGLDINLVRDQDTNKSMGFAFVKYEDQRSTILAVDNFNGIKLLGRTLRCDHVEKYKLPKEIRKKEEEELDRRPDATVHIGPGHAYRSKELQNEFNISKGQDLWAGSKVDEKGDKKRKKHKHMKEKKHINTRSRDIDREEEEENSWGSTKGHTKEEISLAKSSFSAGSSSNYTTAISMSSVVSSDPIPSWRGRMDPSVVALEEAQRKKLAAGEIAKRDEFDGIGGMKRRR